MTKTIAFMHVAGLAAVGGLVARPQALAADKTPTTMQISAGPAPGRAGKPGVGAAGGVTPAPSAGERVVVKYFKRHNGHWVLRAPRHPKLDGEGVYQTTF